MLRRFCSSSNIKNIEQYCNIIKEIKKVQKYSFMDVVQPKHSMLEELKIIPIVLLMKMEKDESNMKMLLEKLDELDNKIKKIS